MANICFNCINAVPDSNGHGCPWSKKFEPVPGWEAERSIIGTNYHPVESYNVKKCPKFEEG